MEQINSQSQDPETFLIKKNKTEFKKPENQIATTVGPPPFPSRIEWIGRICNVANPILLYEKVRENMTYGLYELYCIYASIAKFEPIKDGMEWNSLQDEYIRFITMKFAIKTYEIATQCQSHKISPPEKIDQVWHAHILNTKKYNDFCNEIGMRIEHSTISAKFVDQREKQLETCKMLYCRFFMKPYEKNVWDEDDMMIFCKTMTGSTITLFAKPSSTVSFLKYLIEQKTGAFGHIIFAGKQLVDEKTLKDYGFQKECTIHTVLPLRGC